MIIDRATDEGMWQIVPLHPGVEPQKQAELRKEYHVPALCIKMSLSGMADISNKVYYPNAWPVLSRELLLHSEFDDEIPHHIVTDSELMWLFGDSIWLSTGLRTDLKTQECRAYRVVFRRGKYVDMDDVKKAYPLSTTYLTKWDYNLITQEESYSYKVAESDYALCVFLQNHRMVVQGMHRWEVGWHVD